MTTTTRSRRVLPRSSWATVDIGDVAHTPGGPGTRPTTAATITRRSARTTIVRRSNAAHTSKDLAVLARAITHWVRRTGEPLVLGSEMSDAVDLAAEYFPRTLPDDVAARWTNSPPWPGW